MTDNVGLVNLALQSYGSRTTVTQAQLDANSNNEAKQANLAFGIVRNSLLRMAPWDCALKTANLVYITSIPGTPENTSAATNLWQPGQPRPPWAYEYQYPVDCLRACWIIPAVQSGFEGSVPITTAVTGSAPSTWLGGPVSFKIGIDQFLMMSTVAPSAAGTGYHVGDTITLATQQRDTLNHIGTFLSSPQGAAAQLTVASVNGSGGVVTASVIPSLHGTIYGGSYFYDYLGAAAQASSSSTGTGATFTSNMSTTPFDQRVIFTNQQNATLAYVREVTDSNVWDPLFITAFYNNLGAVICMALTGDKVLSNKCIDQANAAIIEARKVDGNEGLTINDVTPDWIRTRGINWIDGQAGPYSFDWGGLLPSYA